MFNKNTYNASRVLQVIWQYKSISRVAISEHVGLNKSTITKILVPLLEMGLVVSGEKLASGHQGGRKAEVLSINESFGYVIGMEITRYTCRFVVTDLAGKVFIEDSFTYSREYEFQELLEYCIEKSESLCKKRDLKILGMTIGVGGVINPYEGIVYRSNTLKITSPAKIYDKLNQFPYPIILENDANCCCSSHLVNSAAKRKRNFLTILGEYREKPERESANSTDIYEIGIGIGFVMKGSIYHGDDFSAGEFQSLMKNRENPSQFDLEPDEIYRIREDEDIHKKVLRELSRNISLLVNTLNISQVIIEGDLVEAEYMLKPILRDEIQRNWVYDSQVDCEITFSKYGDNAVAYGAACNYLEKLFSPPKFWENRGEYYPSGVELFSLVI